MTRKPNPPTRRLPSNWQHFDLYKNVRDAIAALPAYFRTETHIAGVSATDLQTLNSVLGATIEEQVVATLNAMRRTWDPDDRYALYNFVRQPQTFPDVRLRRASPPDTLLGIELKGWYLLAKEGEPSLRFQQSAKACADQDLIAIVPWALANVISGSPIVLDPYVESARYAAEYRNYHWQFVRDAKGSTEITLAAASPYPMKSEQILDRPIADGGGNFGRIARTGIMDDYMAQSVDRLLCGIKIEHWQRFLRSFQEQSSDEEVRAALDRLGARIRAEGSLAPANREAALGILQRLAQLMGFNET